MALLESRLRYGCCGRAGFRAKYNDELKGKITEKLLKRDLKDISEEFRNEQPSFCLYTLLPPTMVGLVFTLCIIR